MSEIPPLREIQIADFRTGSTPPLEQPASTTRQIAKFIRGPINLLWIQRAAVLPGRVLHVAVALRYQDGFKRGAQFRIQPSIMRGFGVSPSSLSRALVALERAGLVKVSRATGRAAEVVILSVE